MQDSIQPLCKNLGSYLHERLNLLSKPLAWLALSTSTRTSPNLSLLIDFGTLIRPTIPLLFANGEILRGLSRSSLWITRKCGKCSVLIWVSESLLILLFVLKREKGDWQRKREREDRWRESKNYKNNTNTHTQTPTLTFAHHWPSNNT